LIITCDNKQTLENDDLVEDVMIFRNESEVSEENDKDKNDVPAIVKQEEFEIRMKEDNGFDVHEKYDLENDDISDAFETKKYNKNCKEAKASLFGRLAIKTLIMSETERVRLFNRHLYKKEKTSEVNKYPGVIVDNQRTKFAVCIKCCEVFCQSAVNKMLKHECTENKNILREHEIEYIYKRNTSTKEIFKKYCTQLRMDKVKFNECGLEKKTISETKKHLRKVHGIDLNKHMCPECGKKFINDMRVRQHQVEKHGYAAEFSCEFCERLFVEKHLLTYHQKLQHTDEKPHVCDVCAQRFKRRGHFNRHKAIHTGEKNFPCRFCMMAFSTEWTRTQHERIHLGIKPYKCDQCGNSFGQKTSLDSHNKVHH